jgi:hypothetical protein
MHFKKAIIPIVRQDESVDENHRVQLLKIDSLQDRILENISFIGYFKNPFLTLWNDRCLLIAQNVPPVTHHLINFKWVSTEDVFGYSLCRSNTNMHDIDNLKSLSILGLDQRVVVINQELLIILYL